MWTGARECTCTSQQLEGLIRSSVHPPRFAQLTRQDVERRANRKINNGLGRYFPAAIIVRRRPISPALLLACFPEAPLPTPRPSQRVRLPRGFHRRGGPGRACRHCHWFVQWAGNRSQGRGFKARAGDCTHWGRGVARCPRGAPRQIVRVGNYQGRRSGRGEGLPLAWAPPAGIVVRERRCVSASLSDELTRVFDVADSRNLFSRKWGDSDWSRQPETCCVLERAQLCVSAPGPALFRVSPLLSEELADGIPSDLEAELETVLEAVLEVSRLIGARLGLGRTVEPEAGARAFTGMTPSSQGRARAVPVPCQGPSPPLLVSLLQPGPLLGQTPPA